ncbi:MAG: thioesterase family protein [Ideonella sp.]|nr:thioesterase family protein [Ideonella sp.]
MSDGFTSFHDLLAARRVDGSRLRFDVPADWQQGRTAYGGLAAAMAAQAMRDVVGAAWPADARLRALQTNFVGPVAPGPASIDVQLLREGKSIRQVMARLTTGSGEVAGLWVGVYGSPRPTAVATLLPNAEPLAFAPGEAPTRPFTPGEMPGLLRHFDIGWAAGAPPYSGASGWATSLYLRLAGDRADLIDPEVLTVLLADLPPTPAISRLTRPAPASSVCWALELLPLAGPVARDGWWRIDTRTRSAGDGYANHSSTLWAPDGTPAAFGHQVVAVYG